MSMKVHLHRFLWLLIAAIASSCVGEMEDVKPKKTDYLDPKVNTFVYPGIVDARAISHDKIEIDFIPKGSSDRYRHLLYVNDTNKPVDLQLETIARIDGGIYRYILQDRSINTSYKLRIAAENKEDGSVSEGETIKVVTTFDNTTADFQGIAKVDPVPGATSTSVIVDWNPATFIGAIGPKSYDPVYYIVTYISDTGGAKNLNNPDYDGLDKQEIRVPSSGWISPSVHLTKTSINSLQPGTKYYFQVRAVHKSWDEHFQADASNIPIKREQNTVYIPYETSPAGGVVDFNKQSLKVSKAPGSQSFTALRATWEAGEGVYTHYRLFVKEFQGTSVENEDELQKALLNYEAPTQVNLPCENVSEGTGLTSDSLPGAVAGDPSLIGCFDIPTTVNNIQINGLKKYTHYQLKVALCLDSVCDLQDGAGNQGILSEIAYEKTEPNLAPFDGIVSLTNPQSAPDEIGISFNAIGVSQGYANTIEVYCVDPDDHNSAFLMPANGAAVSATGTACDGLTAKTEAGNDLSTINYYGALGAVNKLAIAGVNTVNTDPSANYCFAITPAITGPVDAPEGDIRMNQSDWVVRCIQPELKVPTMEEFPGSTGGCSVLEDSVAISWGAPSGGLYENYSLFYKEKDSAGFSFYEAINGNPSYTAVEDIAGLTHTVQGLTPGKSYLFGVVTALDSSGVKVYSEANTNIEDCYLPLPTAAFKEWTRVLALGPKVDGRIPLKDYSDDNPWPGIRSTDLSVTDYESKITEAISTEGIPYEVESVADINSYFSNPPGQDTSNFSPASITTFDGALSEGATGYAASKNGIVSLAWKEMELSFLGAEFQTAQDAQGADRSARDFGYRVYRSHDYGSSWEEVTHGNLITSVSYSYRKRSNVAPVSERMAFFTDYSVKHLYDLKDVARARIYLYKVVPVYKGKELQSSYSDGHNIIRVTLPPPNMALVHRRMANRTLCMELGKNIETDNNYVCEYNGLGARQRGVPWQVGSTVIDQGGDLLVDRFELGCNYTRGELTGGSADEYKSGSSFFDLDGIDDTQGPGITTDNSSFKGYATSGAPFRGCRAPYWGTGAAAGYSFENNGGYILDENNPYSSVNPSYDQMVFGDCIGDNTDQIPLSHDPNGADAFSPDMGVVSLPGAVMTDQGAGYSPEDTSDPDDPQFLGDYIDSVTEAVIHNGKYGKAFRSNVIAQAEFAAVYHNRTSQNGRRLSPLGPGYGISSEGENIVGDMGSTSYKQSCFVNLASIGNTAEGSLWRSRWIPATFFDRVSVKTNVEEPDPELATGNLELMTLDEIQGTRSLYDPEDEVNNFRPVPSALWDGNRIKGDMPLGRVVSSNSAKLPPLSGAPNQVLQNICSTYKVQVGLAGDGGGFQPFAAVKEKRLIRRSESVIAAKFPEEFSNSLNAKIEKGGTDLDVVNGRPIKSCNGEAKTFANGESFHVGKLLNGRYPSAGNDGVFATGSGELDGGDSTESCVSKFGIQDLAGNVSESNSDTVFCDYDSEAMGIYFGEDGNPDASVPYPYANNFSGTFYTDVNAYLCLEQYGFDSSSTAPGAAPSQCPDCLWSDPDGDGTYAWCRLSGNKLWRRVTSYAGYCSIVDSSSTKIGNSNNFRNISQVFEPIFSPDGNVNPLPISREKPSDQEAVDTLRNGDGFFANFGESNLGPGFKYADSFSFTGIKGKYFSPITGLPMTCANYGARESCGETPDNMDVTLQGWWSNHNVNGDPPGLAIDDFPVGNSKGKSHGIADVTGSDSAFVLNHDYNSGSRRIVRGIVNEDGGGATVDLESQASTENVYAMRWYLHRGTLLQMFSGGNFEASSGAMSIEVFGENFHRHYETGSRCAVLINEEY